ncbi:MAG: hypothetical protein LH645_02935 [Actinomycetia bacterium]|nr:hypothetical protein [Actinomycetes bacterium]
MVPPGVEYDVSEAGGSTKATTPKARMLLENAPYLGFLGTVFVARTLVGPIGPSSSVTWLSQDNNQSSAIVAALAELDPTIRPDYVSNGALLALYQENRGGAIMGGLLGLSLGLIALGLSVVDRIRERRYSEVSVVILGAPRKAMLKSRVLQVVLAISVVAVTGWLVSQMIATTYLAVSGLAQGLFLPGLVFGAVVAALGLAVVVFVVLVQPPVRLTPEDLHSE